MAKGDHILVPLCGPFTHHGIDIGDGTVVHWSSGIPGEKHLLNKPTRKSASLVRRTSLDEFGDLAQLKVREYGSCFDADTVVQRALSRVDEAGYGVGENNCEHFATWCKTGEHRSEQVKDVAATVLGVGGAGGAVGGGVRVVSAAGPVRGLGGEGVVAGLGAVGRVVRGGPAAGLVLVAAAPAAVSVLAVRSILNDDESLPDAEREARANGRAASVGGAVLGTAGSVGAVAALGVPGLSAIGISTSLTALGGGSVAVGLSVVVAFPAVATLGVGWLVYKLTR